MDRKRIKKNDKDKKDTKKYSRIVVDDDTGYLSRGHIDTKRITIDNKVLSTHIRDVNRVLAASESKTVRITNEDTFLVINQEVKENGFCLHAKQSVNDFYNIGIREILKEIYPIKYLIDNERNKSPQDEAIKKIEYSIEFDNIRLKNPTATVYSSGHDIPIYPIQSHIEDKTYCSNLIVDATIRTVAYTKDGKEIPRSAEVKDFKLTRMLTMTGSNICNTYAKSRETLINAREDPRDPQAYFIRNGKAWSIDSLESICFNQPRIFNNAWKIEKQRLEIISRAGDTYQNQKQTIIRLQKNGALTIEFVAVNTFRGIHFPFYIIFRMLGWSTDKEIFDNILYCDIKTNTNKLKIKMANILQDAMNVSYDTKLCKFAGATNIHHPTDMLEFVAKQLPSNNRNLNMSDETNLHQMVNRLLQSLDEDFLMHIGKTEQMRHNKLRFLSHLINRMLMVNLQVILPTDRDSYVSKRIKPPGVLLANSLKTHYGQSIIPNVKKEFSKAFRVSSYHAVQLATVFENSMNGADLERLMAQSIASGTKTSLKVSKFKTITNRLSTQLIEHDNQTKILSTLRMIISPNSESANGTERAKDMRQPHLSSQGYCCLIQSPASGEKVGIHKQLAISASISSFGAGEIMKSRLLDDASMMPLCDVNPYDVDLCAKVFSNGEWIGCVTDSSALVKKYTRLRRNMDIDKTTTIEWDNKMNEVYFWVDNGRLLRPLLIVYNNVDDWEYLGLDGPADIKHFKQCTGLTSNIITSIMEGKIGMSELLKLQIIEYITPSEQIRLFIAAETSHLYDHEYDPLVRFTHCDVPEAMLGIAALVAPFANHNQTPKNTVHTSQVRQAGGLFASNWPFRYDKGTFLQYQIGTPIVRTCTDNWIDPNGDMARLAVMSYTGYNEEDSNVSNKAMSERGKFSGCLFSYEKIEIEKGEELAQSTNTQLSICDVKPYANYRKIGKRGYVEKGTIVSKNDVLVRVIKKLPRNIAVEKKADYSDRSLVYKHDFPCIVLDVIITKDDESKDFCKIQTRSLKPITTGDKFSTRHGQKGVVGISIPQSDMPFSENGQIVDIIMNPHGFPSRTTPGQLLECSISKICAHYGTTFDGTMFKPVNMDVIVEELEKCGFSYKGNERLYCGITGNWIDSLMFVGPVFMERLQKFVTRAIYSIDVGPTDVLTHQALDGRSNSGGLRISELHRDVLLSHGCSRFLSEKYFDDADGFDVYVCRECGNWAIVNQGLHLYKCITCKDNADIYSIHSSFSSKLFLQEINACHIGIRLDLRPFTFYNQL